MTGYPISAANFFSSSGSWLEEVTPGIRGMLGSCWRKYALAERLSPRLDIALELGPMNVIPALRTASAKVAFSLR